MKHVPRASGDWLQGAGYAKKVLLTGDDLNAEGTLVQLIEIAAGDAVAPHYHEHCTEVFHGISGRGTFVIDGRAIVLEPGDTLTCEPGEVHETRNDDDKAFVYVVFKTNVTPDDLNWVQSGPD